MSLSYGTSGANGLTELGYSEGSDRYGTMSLYTVGALNGVMLRLDLVVTELWNSNVAKCIDMLWEDLEHLD